MYTDYVYLPSEYVNNCNVVYNGYIRSYTNSNYTQWVDIYVNQNYMKKYGSSNYSQTVVCDSANIFTSDILYKIGYVDSLFNLFTLGIIFAIFLGLCRRSIR